MKYTLFSRNVQIACVITHAILRMRSMRFYAFSMRLFATQKRNAFYLNSPGYLTTRMINYGFDQNMKLFLEPQVSSIGRWNDSESFEGQAVVSFIHEIRLVTLQLPDSVTEDIQKVIQDELNKSNPRLLRHSSIPRDHTTSRKFQTEV